MLAGLPKAPSALQPDQSTPTARAGAPALHHRADAGERLHHRRGRRRPPRSRNCKMRTRRDNTRVHAEYVAETVRQLVYAQYGDEAYTRGLNVFTTVKAAQQEAAYKALRKGIMDYERRQIYRGPEEFVDLPANAKEAEDAIDDALADHPDNGDVMSAVVLEASPKKIVAVRQNGEHVEITGDGLRAGAVGPVRQGAAQDQDPPRRGDPRGQDAQEHLGDHPAARSRRRLRRAGPARRRHPGAGRRLRLQQEQVQPRHAGLAPAGLGLQALHLLGGAGKGLHARPPSSTTRRCSSTPASPAASPGSRRTTTASSKARCRCTRRWRSRRTWCRSASCRPSARRTRRTGSPASASTPTSTRPT